jgi:uncharacterized circularly permuted ATP-grasp superfamily protein
VARVANVLAIAVLGSVMMNAFGNQLDQRLATLSLSPDVVHSMQAEKIKLAGLEVPATLDPNTRAAVLEAVHNAFVSGFRLVMLICAALAIAGAVIVLWLVS